MHSNKFQLTDLFNKLWLINQEFHSSLDFFLNKKTHYFQVKRRNSTSSMYCFCRSAPIQFDSIIINWAKEKEHRLYGCAWNANQLVFDVKIFHFTLMYLFHLFAQYCVSAFHVRQTVGRLNNNSKIFHTYFCAQHSEYSVRSIDETFTIAPSLLLSKCTELSSCIRDGWNSWGCSPTVS